jgi:hypothetical protein
MLEATESGIESSIRDPLARQQRSSLARVDGREVDWPLMPTSCTMRRRKRENSVVVNTQKSAKLGEEPAVCSTSNLYAWSVFGLTFLLMMSDFISRQVIVAIFPFLKAEWALQ